MIDQILLMDDEWTESADNEPDAEADREFAETLTDETEEDQC